MAEPTYEQHMAALRRAHAAGDEEAARRIAALARQARERADKPKRTVPGAYGPQILSGVGRSLDKTGRGFIEMNLALADKMTGGWELPERARAAVQEGSQAREQAFNQNATGLARGAEMATDIGQFFVPASGVAKLQKAAPMLQRAAGQAAGAMGLDGLQQQGEGQEGIDAGRMALTGTFAGGAELAAPVIGRAYQAVRRAYQAVRSKIRGDNPVEIGRAMAKDLGMGDVSDDEATRLFAAGDEIKAGANPEAIAFEAETGIKLRRAQKTGNREDWRQDEFLAARNNPRMVDARNQQRAAVEDLRGNLTNNLDSPQTAVADIQSAVRGAKDEAKSAVKEAWRFADDTDLSVSGKIASSFGRHFDEAKGNQIMTDGAEKVLSRVSNILRGTPEEAPLIQIASGVSDDALRGSFRSGAVADSLANTATSQAPPSKVTFEQLLRAQRTISDNIRTAPDAATKLLLTKARRAMESTFDDVVDSTVLSGNVQDIENLRKAVSTSRDMFQRFMASGSKDRVGKVVERLVEDGNLDELSNFLLGSSAVSKPAAANAAKAVRRALGDSPEALASMKEAVLFKVMSNQAGDVAGEKAIASNLKKTLTQRRELLSELFTKREISQLEVMAKGFDSMSSPFPSSGTTERKEAFRAYTSQFPLSRPIWAARDAIEAHRMARRAFSPVGLPPESVPLLPATAGATQSNRQ